MIYQRQHVKSRNAVHTGGPKIWKYFGENSEIFAIRKHVEATSKENLTSVFSWSHIISGKSPKFFGCIRTCSFYLIVLETL